MLQRPVTLPSASATTRTQLKERGGLFWRLSIPAVVAAALSGCGPNYSPDTYSANAVQQANKVEQGVIVGVRDVAVSAAGTVGTVTGAAAGGIAGSQAVPSPISAFTALSGSLVGGIAGSAVEHTTADTTAFEYIVRKANGDLVSVTQKDKTPLALGQKVLVIAGNQARVVPDYTVAPPAPVAGPAAARPVAATAGMPSKPEDAPAATADTKPVEPLKAGTAPPSPAVADPVSSPAAPTPATTPAAPVAPAPTPDAKPADTPSHAS
jgi:outer membrane lipoprotein SlyB